MTSTKSMLLALAVFLTGCITKIDQPPPAGWTYHTGNGATQKEIEAAYLECGFPVPGDFRQFSNDLLVRLGVGDVHKQYAALAEQEYCLRNAGFPMGGLRDPCETDYAKNNYPVCQPGAVIPRRSIENRLNSPYCNIYPKAAICQPAYDPRAPQTTTSISVSPKPISVAPSTDQAIKLQEQVQRDSNAQMNQLLQGVRNRK